VVFLVAESERIGQEPPDSPYLGVLGENAEVGARLKRVVEKGPAAQAGAKPGDIVIAVDDETVLSWSDFLRAIRQHVAGEKVRLEVSRDRERVMLGLELGARPKAKEPTQGQAAHARDGMPPPPSSPFGAFLGGQRPNLQDQQGKDGKDYGGVYRSADGGDTWTRVNSLDPRPMYFSEIRVDPGNEKNLWVLGMRMWRSKDGGKTFTADGVARGVHPDQHALWVDPTDGRHLILGNDGGIYVSYDRGAHFDHLNQVAIGQFYDVGLGPRRDYRVYGGPAGQRQLGRSRTASRTVPVRPTRTGRAWAAATGSACGWTPTTPTASTSSRSSEASGGAT